MLLPFLDTLYAFTRVVQRINRTSTFVPNPMVPAGARPDKPRATQGLPPWKWVRCARAQPIVYRRGSSSAGVTAWRGAGAGLACGGATARDAEPAADVCQ